MEPTESGDVEPTIDDVNSINDGVEVRNRDVDSRRCATSVRVRRNCERLVCK